LRALRVFLAGNNHKLIIRRNCNLRGAIYLRQSNSIVEVEESTTWVSVRCFAMEGKSIIIGADCMFSDEVIIRTSDEHSIFDMGSGSRINMAADVSIGSHVWLGSRVTVGKGVSIASGCVIGSYSLISKSLSEPNAIYAGVPAQIRRSGIQWSRHLIS